MRTYASEAGFSPTRMKASPGVMPRRDSRSSVSAFTSRLISSAIFFPSMMFICPKPQGTIAGLKRRIDKTLEFQGFPGLCIGTEKDAGKAHVGGCDFVLI